MAHIRANTISAMIKRLFFVLLTAAALCACKDPYTEQYTIVNVDFDYDRLSPMTFSFTNNSTGCTSYRWDFGNGMFSNGRDAMITYEACGTYNVTLTGTDADGQKHRYSETVKVTQPTVYIAGYTLYKIPYENQYYKLEFKDDNLLPSSWDFNIIYSPMLNNTDLPYTYRLNNPVPFDNLESHTYYTVQVYRSANASSSGDKSCLKQKMYVKDILTYQPELILRTETDGTVVGVLFGYEY